MSKSSGYSIIAMGAIKASNLEVIRIIKTGNRQGDAAEMALIELVDFNEIYSNGKTAKVEKAKTTRRSRAKKTTDAAGTTETKSEGAE
jgi:large subunit ribosomal protein L17